MNVWAVCEATVPVLSAVATLAMEDKSKQPASLTLMAGPINPHAIAKSEVSECGRTLNFEGVSRQPDHRTLSARYDGAGREVYPSFRQIDGFKWLNAPEHLAKLT